MCSLIQVHFSEEGEDEEERVKEESTYSMFVDLLYDSEGNVECKCIHLIIISAKNVELKLEDILMLFTGTADIPPNGFHAIPTVNFSYSEVFPTAATCFNELTLPTKYNGQPQMFREKFIFAISNHRGFGAP